MMQYQGSKLMKKACHQAQAQLDTLREQVHSQQNKQEQLSPPES
jgi:hypothetical protein